jgi:hypothetical protein
MSRKYLPGYKFEGESHIGPENGAFHVRPIGAIPEDKRSMEINGVYIRTPFEIASGASSYTPPRIKSKHQEAVYAFVNRTNTGGGRKQSIIGHTFGSHERVGGLFRGYNVANLDSVFTRRFEEDVDHIGLRESGIALAQTFVWLGEFDQDTPVTVMNVYPSSREEAVRLDVTLEALGFTAMTGGKTSRNNAASNKTWYHGPSTGELRDTIAADSVMLSDAVKYLIEAPEPPVDPIAMGLGSRSGIGSIR